MMSLLDNGVYPYWLMSVSCMHVHIKLLIVLGVDADHSVEIIEIIYNKKGKLCRQRNTPYTN